MVCEPSLLANGLDTLMSRVLEQLLPTTPAWARQILQGKVAARESEIRHHGELFDARVCMTLVLEKKEVAA